MRGRVARLRHVAAEGVPKGVRGFFTERHGDCRAREQAVVWVSRPTAPSRSRLVSTSGGIGGGFTSRPRGIVKKRGDNGAAEGAAIFTESHGGYEPRA